MFIYVGAKATLLNSQDNSLITGEVTQIDRAREGEIVVTLILPNDPTVSQTQNQKITVTINAEKGIIMSDENNTTYSKLTVIPDIKKGDTLMISPANNNNNEEDGSNNANNANNVKAKVLELDDDNEVMYVQIIPENNINSNQRVDDRNNENSIQISYKALPYLTITKEVILTQNRPNRPNTDRVSGVAATTDATARGEDDGVIKVRGQYGDARERLTDEMIDQLDPNLPSNMRNMLIARIIRECYDIIALSRAYTTIITRNSISRRKDLSKYENKDNKIGNVPIWVVPIVKGIDEGTRGRDYSKKDIYETKSSINRNVNDYKEFNQKILRISNYLNIDIIVQQYFKKETYSGSAGVSKEKSFDEVRNKLTRPFKNCEGKDKNSYSSQIEGVFDKNSVLKVKYEIDDQGKKNYKGVENNVKDRIIQVFTDNDKLCYKNDDFLVSLECRDYSRSFLPTTNILDKLRSSQNNHNILGTSCFTQNNAEDMRSNSSLPEMKDNLKYIIDLVESNEYQIHKMLSAYLLVSQLNFDNIYWHNLEFKYVKDVQDIISKFQKDIKKRIERTREFLTKSYDRKNKNKGPEKKEKGFVLESLYGIGRCGREETEYLNIINGYGFKREMEMTVSELLDKMMNTDYGDVYYKYLNYCNTNLQIGGEDSHDNFLELQDELLCGKHAINNMLGREVAVADFSKLDDKYVKQQDGKDLLNLAYICVQCNEIKLEENNKIRKTFTSNNHPLKKLRKEDEFCINEYGEFEVVVILKALSDLRYNFSIYPKDVILDYDLSKCNFLYDQIDEDPDATLNNVVEEIVSKEDYEGSIIYKSGEGRKHYTAIRLSTNKENLYFVDSIACSNSPSISTVKRSDTSSIRTFLEGLLDIDKLKEFHITRQNNQQIGNLNNLNVYVIINVTSSTESSEISEISEIGTQLAPQSYTQVDQGTPQSNTQVDPGDGQGSQEDPGDSQGSQEGDQEDDGSRKGSENSKNSNNSTNRERLTTDISTNFCDKVDFGDDKDMKELERQKYNDNINNSKLLYQYDDFICRNFEVNNKYSMKLSINSLARMKEMETIRLFKYQSSNYVRVLNIQGNESYFSHIMGKGLNDKNEDEVELTEIEYERLLSVSHNRWERVHNILLDLGNNIVTKKYTYTTYSEEENETNRVEVWIETFVGENMDRVKVMPQYWREISNAIFSGLRQNETLKILMMSLYDKNEVRKDGNQYICNYTNLDLDIQISEDAMNLFHSGTVSDSAAQQEDNNAEEVVKAYDSDSINLMNECKVWIMEYIDMESENPEEIVNLVREYAKLVKSSPLYKVDSGTTEKEKKEEKKKEKEQLRLLKYSCFIICLQASSYFCKLKTKTMTKKKKNKSQEKDKENTFVNFKSVLVLSGYPADTTETGNHDSLIQYFQPLYSKDEADVKAKIDIILKQNPSVYDRIKSNWTFSRENIPNETWYKKKWNTFLPPLFPTNITADKVTIGKVIQGCSSDKDYSTKLLILSEISNISFFIRQKTNKSNTEGIKQDRDKILTLSRLVKICFNYPSSPRYIVSKKIGDNKTEEEIRVFSFSEKFQNEFIQYYSTGTSDKTQTTKATILKVLNEINSQNIIPEAQKYSEASEKQLENSNDTVSTSDCIIATATKENRETPLQSILNNLRGSDGNNLPFNKFIKGGIDGKDGKDRNKNRVILTSICLQDASVSRNNKRIVDIVNLESFFKVKTETTNEGTEEIIEMPLDDFDRSTVTNFWRVNFAGIVKVYYKRYLEEKRKKENKTFITEIPGIQDIQSWYNCWRDNLSYYGYDNEFIVSDIYNSASQYSASQSSQIIAYKLRFTLCFLICLGLESKPEINKQYSSDIPLDYFDYALDKVKENSKCLQESSPNKLKAELSIMKQKERNDKVNRYSGNIDFDLMRRTEKAGISVVTKKQKEQDLGTLE